MTTPLLSVCLITYNHVKYIKQAVEGVLIQEVDFVIELIIADDFSTDGTRDILLEYKNKYPKLITLILQEKNVGPARNWIDLITSPKSKYIAYFEGDDYWTDPLKLKKQVTFLENNENFTLVFHNAFVKHENVEGKDHSFCGSMQDTTTIKDVIKSWYIPSVSMVFRKDGILPLPLWFETIYNGDYALHLMLATKGEIKYLNETMGVYRKNSGALSGSYSTIKNIKNLIKLFKIFNKETHQKYFISIIPRLTDLYFQLVYMTIKTQFFQIKQKG